MSTLRTLSPDLAGPARPFLPRRLAGLSRLTGWRRAGAAALAGALGALAMAPFSLWPVLAISFPVLVLLLDGCAAGPRRLRAAAGVGWCFGFGYFLASLWWIGAAFLVEADVFGWLLPFAVIAMPAGLALFTGLGTALAMLLWRPGPRRLAAFAVGLTVAEWLRGHVLTGFPWNTFGYAFADSLPLMQGAALVGLYGLTFLVLLLLATPVLLLEGRRGALLCALAAAVLAGWAGLGILRLQAHPTRLAEGVHLRLMQPNLPQDKKFAYGRRQEVLDDYLALSRETSPASPHGLADVTVLIWPESAFPFIYEREPWAAEAIAATLPANVTLVTGAVRYGAPPPGQHSPFFNAIRVIDHQGTVLTSTDKVHLVPFGEYLPFQNTLESLGLEQLTRVRGGFSSGARLMPLRVPGLPLASPLVCYEAIFPGEIIPEGERPRLLLNLTNDGWFGNTPGPYQHFAQARLRAVEQGLPLVRAANTGISAVVDPMGRIVAGSRLNHRSVVDSGLPVDLEVAPPAAGWAHAALILLLSCGLILSAPEIRRQNTRQS